MTGKSVIASAEKSQIFVLSTLAVLLVGVIIAIPIVYSVGRNADSRVNQVLTNITNDSMYAECTDPLKGVEAFAYLLDSEPFPFRPFIYLYRPRVILKQIAIIFGFGHDQKSWAIDRISVVDTTTGDEQFMDGDFESNYLSKNYQRCILSKTQSSSGDILFDNPYSGDFYYNDQTYVGISYLIQTINVVGGRYYNISFYLENRGDPQNTFLFLIAYDKGK